MSFVASRAAEILPLAETLRDAEIAHRIGEMPPVADGAPVRYALLVEEEDAADALRAIGPALLNEDHDAEAEAVETRFAAGRGGYVECPACGARQPEGAAECPECGLGLGGEATPCAKCGQPLPEPGDDCPACGALAPR
ncbi:MAG: zinc ribbon domain-containing protein [Vicinamibacteria bacterium]